MRHMVAIALWLAIALALCPTASAQTSFRWKFQKGQTFTVVGTQETKVETSVNNKARRAALEMTMHLEWTVDEVSESGVATITQSFTRLALTTTAPEAEPVSYDSAATGKPTGAAREIAAGVAPLVGAKFIVTMDPRGDVTEVKLPEETEKILAELPETSELKKLLTPAGLMDLFRLGGGTLPEKEVSPGDTWPATSETDTPFGKLVQTGEFTFAGQDEIAGRKLDKIELKSTAKLVPKAGAPLRLDVQEQSKTGVLLFDSAAGKAVLSETKLNSKSVRPFRDQKIEVKITGVTKLEIK